MGGSHCIRIRCAGLVRRPRRSSGAMLGNCPLIHEFVHPYNENSMKKGMEEMKPTVPWIVLVFLI